MFDYRKAASYCREPIILIEGAWEAASDTNNFYVLRHRLELEHTPEELRKLRKWYNRPANELYFERQAEPNELH